MTTAVESGIAQVIYLTRVNGGATVSMSGEQVPEFGYMVGGWTDSLIFDGNLIKDPSHAPFLLEKIGKWLDAYRYLIQQPEYFVGGWIDTETGEAYIDISRWYGKKSTALDSARVLNELAIWDLANRAEIRI